MKIKKAFTLIEIIIAIVIFSVGILSVLRLVTSNLSLMDKNNLRTQATLLAKEGMELVYNLRDANIKKELSWNCLMKDEMYLRSSDDLSNEIGRGNQSNFENIICDGYFGTGQYLKISFDSQMYVYHKLSDKSQNFDENFVNNRLYLYTGDVSGTPMFWYAYENNGNNGIETNFARYLSFEQVKEGSEYLPLDKIMKVNSHVLYMKMGFTGEVVFESFIGNY